MISAIKRAGSQLLMGWLWDGPGSQTSFAYDPTYLDHPDAVPLDPDRLPLSTATVVDEMSGGNDGPLLAFRLRDVSAFSPEVLNFAEATLGAQPTRTAVWKLSALSMRSEPHGLSGLLVDPCHCSPSAMQVDSSLLPRLTESQAKSWGSFRSAVRAVGQELPQLAMGALSRHSLGAGTSADARHFYPSATSSLVHVGAHGVERERLLHEIPAARLAAAYQRMASLVPDLAPFVRPGEYVVAKTQHTNHYTIAYPLSASREYQVLSPLFNDAGLERMRGASDDGVTYLVRGQRCGDDILDCEINSDAQHISDAAYKDSYPEPYNKPALDFLSERMDRGDLVNARAFYAHYVLNAYWGIFVLADQHTELVARAASTIDYEGVERRVLHWSPGEIRSPEGAAFMPHKLSMHLQPELPYFVQAAAAQLMLSRHDEQAVRADVLRACLEWPAIEADLGLSSARGGLAPTITGGDLWDGIKSKARKKADMVRSYREEHQGVGQ